MGDGKKFGCGLAAGLVVGMAVGCFGTALVFAGYWMTAGRQAEALEAWEALPCPKVGDERVTALLEPIRAKHNVPAIAGAIVTSEGLVAVGAVGFRRRGDDVAVTLDDRWHLGSDGKAMTATTVARLVEQGHLSWDTSMEEVFPDLAPGFHEDFKGITPLHLLSHRAGLPANLNLVLYRGDDVQMLRLRALQKELAKAPASEPGSEYLYSNLGYILAGAVTERVDGPSWEDVIRREVFDPLGMHSVGFGGTGTPGKLDQPWGHTKGGEPVATNGPPMDNLPVMGPAGRIHCSIQDWARFIQDQLRGAQGEAGLLEAATYRVVHTPPFGGDYALGWGVKERSWGGGEVLAHCGDNTMNFANAWVAPKRDFAILVCVNQSGDTAFKASDDAVGGLIGLHEAMQ